MPPCRCLVYGTWWHASRPEPGSGAVLYRCRISPPEWRAEETGRLVPGVSRVRRIWRRRCRGFPGRRFWSGGAGRFPCQAGLGHAVPNAFRVWWFLVGGSVRDRGARMLDHFLSDPWVLPLLLSECPVAGSGGESGQRTMGSLWLKIWIQLGTELWTSWLCIRSRELSGMTLMGSRIWFRRRHSSRPMSEKSTRMVR